MFKKTAVLGMAGLLGLSSYMAGAAKADIVLEIDYNKLDISYTAISATQGTFTITSKSTSAATAFILDTNTNAFLDTADIFNNLIAPGAFSLNTTLSINNAAGDDNIVATGSLAATDTVTTLVNPSLHANVKNTKFGSDADGFIFDPQANKLTIIGVLTPFGANTSILNAPAAGDWVYVGEASDSAGSDGIADQLTISASKRANYTRGALTLIEINLSRYANGTAITATNADELFAQAFANGGFASTSAQVQVTVVPAPAAALLGTIGMGLMGWLRRKTA